MADRIVESNRLKSLASLCPFFAVALFTIFSIIWAADKNDFQDFFIYRAGAKIALSGQSPYDLERIRVLVVEQYPDPDAGQYSFVNNCGYFLPPEAIIVFLPFALLPFLAAKCMWSLVYMMSALASLLIPRLFGRSASDIERLWLVTLIAPFLILFSPTLTLPVVIVGQTTLLMLATLVVGQWCFDHSHTLIGALFWSIAFIKPHLAFPFLALAWYQGGWKRAGLIALIVALLTLGGAFLVDGSPRLIGDYAQFLGQGHKAVAYNRVELNPQITSWNRLLFATSGTLIELTVSTTLAGYLIWIGLLASRIAWQGSRPSSSWMMASAVAGSTLCSQVIGYETLLLALALPWFFDLLLAGKRYWSIGFVAILLIQWIPYPAYLGWVESLHLSDRAEATLLSFRAFGVAAFALAVLFGPNPPEVVQEKTNRVS